MLGVRQNLFYLNKFTSQKLENLLKDTRHSFYNVNESHLYLQTSPF